MNLLTTGNRGDQQWARRRIASFRNDGPLSSSTTTAFTILFIVVCCWSTGVAYGARSPPTPIVVNKCCRNGETLDTNQQCLIGSTEHWWPSIFMIAKQDLYKQRGDAPRFFHVRERWPPSCEHMELITGNHNIVLFSNGTLYLPERKTTIEPDNFCVDKDAALVCFSRPQGMDSLRAPIAHAKIRKCCHGEDEILEANSSNCVAIDGTSTLATRKLLQNASAIGYLYGVPTCDKEGYAVAGKFNESNLDVASGTLYLPEGKFETDQYCLEHLNDSDTIEVNVMTCAEYLTPNVERASTNDNVRLLIIGVALLISAIFLIATLGTGFLLPTNHHVLHWRCQTYYVAFLTIGDLLLAIAQLSGNSIRGLPCTAMAISMHFFFLAAFFWLNTMCFNIWWTFRDFRPTSLEKGQELVRLRIYAVYAWGVPFVIMTIALILDNLPDSYLDVLRPNFGKSKCGFEGKEEMLPYFIGPLGFLLFTNLLLFLSTARQLTCGLWKRDDVKSSSEKAALGRVCLKLVVVMGVTWVTDVVSWAHENYFNGSEPQYSYIWMVTDLINALHGVFIFIVVGCQPQVSTAIKRFWSSKTGRCTTNTTHGPQHSTSSQGLPSIGESVTNNTFTTTNSKVPLETIC